MNKIAVLSLCILVQGALNAFPIMNQTGHDVYLRMSFVAGPMSAPTHKGQITGYGPKMILKAGATKKITVPPLLAPTDSISIIAFFSDAAGTCYADHVVYNVGFLTPAGLLLHKSQPTLNANAQKHVGIPIMLLNTHFSANGMCDYWYQLYVDASAAKMPASKP